jgi:outer membrane protein assembly factor BamB
MQKSTIPSVLLLLALASTALAQISAAPGDWPQWRGPKRDGISNEKGLLKEWPKDGPKLLWQVDHVGAGYSSIAVKGNRIYTQGDLNGVEHILCLDAKDGSVLWAVQPGLAKELLATRVATEFAQLDKDKDGSVSEVEALARFGWDWNKNDRPTREEAEPRAQRRAEALFQQLDKDANGKLSFDEAGQLLRDTFERIDRADNDSDATALAKQRTEAFLKLDADGDGRVSRKEAKNTPLDRQFGRIDEKDATTNKGDDLLSAEEIEASLVKFEAGRDGELSLEEVRQHYLQSPAKGDGVLTAEELASALGGYRNGMGDGPRGTPTVDGDFVYIEGGNGDVACLDAATGKTVWSVNLRSDFGGGVPGWGYSESPLVVGDWLIVTPGGKAGTVAALNKKDGKVVWRSTDVTEGAHYSSPVYAEIGGVKQIVQFANQSVFGVTLESGKMLWRYTAPANGTANCCDPIIEGDFVFAASAYGTGGGLARIVPAGSLQAAEEVYFEKKMGCHHGGIVKLGDYMYSAAAGSLICMEYKTGKIMWQSRGVGRGALCVADGMLYVLGENHEMALVEATAEEYREHGRFKIQEHGRPAWAHPVVAGGRLYLRDQESLSAYDLRSGD